MRRWLAFGMVMAAAMAAQTVAQRGAPSIRLEDHAWPDVEPHFGPDAVVVIPLGAAAKEHGPHLKLRNDLTLAEYLTRRVAESVSVVVAPALTYHFYPAFLEYPGSTSLGLETARDLTVDVVRSLAQHGPRRFYVLNTGISTNRPLQLAERILAGDGILLRYTDFSAAIEPVARGLRQQTGGTHADEIETSLMLHIAPHAVDMSRAQRDYSPRVDPFRLTRRRDAKGVYSPTGIWGDPTLATADKGAQLADGLVKAMVADIGRVRADPLPAAAPTASQPRDGAAAAPGAPPRPGGCSDGDVRAIREVGDAYTYQWSAGDADRFAALWTPQGDIVHPDGMIERTAEVIQVNRRELFSRREYRNSKHPLALTMIRCVGYDTAVADGRWSLNSVRDTAGKELPPYEGQATLVMRRLDGGWRIEAYRYTMKAATTQPPPIWLKRPGWPGKQ